MDTGLTQQNLALGASSLNEPPLDGIDVPSRVQVIPMAPMSNWTNVTHGEPYVDAITGTVHVSFMAEVAPQQPFQLPSLNVLFWDPHTIVGPGQADFYEPVIIYAAGNQLSKVFENDPQGFLINPIFGTPDGIAVIEIDQRTNSGQIVPQPQPEGVMQVAPFRTSVGGPLEYNAESHHFNISNDRTRLLCFGINSNTCCVYDITGANRYYPQLIAVTLLDPTGYMGPHDAYEMGDGTFILTMSGQMASVPPGKGPGGIARISRDGVILPDVMATNHTLFSSAAISISINERGIMAYPEFQTHYYYDQWPPGALEIGNDVVFFAYNVNNPGVPITTALQTVVLQEGPDIGYHASSPTWLPGSLDGKEVLFVMTISAGLFMLTRPANSNAAFVAQLIYKLPAGNAYPQHAAMHGILMTVGATNQLKYNKLYLTDTWGDTLHVLDLSNGLPPVGQYFSTAPGATYSVKTIANKNIHWAAFEPSGKRLYTSNMLFSLYDSSLGKYPPATTYEIRQYEVSADGTVTPTPNFSILAPNGYGFVKFKLRHSAAHPGTHE